MSFTPFKNDSGDPDCNAVLEQTTLTGAVYWNRRDSAEAMLALIGGGTVRAWQFNEASWPPSWALLQQGNHLYVVLAGSTSSVHWYGNIVGCYAVQYGSFPNFVHNFFDQVWQGLRVSLIQNMPAGFETMPISFVGHSFGSAVAFLGALEWRRRFGTVQVEYMGLAKPKPLTDGYTGALPQSRYFISTGNDCVSQLPPNSLVLGVLDALSQWQYSVPMDWRHYSPGYRFDADDVLRLRGPREWDTTPSAGQISATPFYHPIGNYMQAAENAWLVCRHDGRDAPIIEMSRQIRGMPAVQNGNVNIDFRQYVDVQQQNQQLFRSQGPGPLTPENLNSVNNTSGVVLGRSSANGIFPALTGGNGEMQKMSFFYHVNSAGYSESHLVPDQANLAAYEALAAAYTAKRLAASGVQTTLDWIRFSTIGTARRVVVFTPFDLPAGTPIRGSFGAGGHGGQQSSDFGATALLLRKVAANGSFSHWFFRGVPDEIVVDGGLYANNVGYTRAIDALGTFCKARGFSWPGTAKEAGQGYPIGALANNGIGQVIFTMTGNPFNGLAAGSRVRIRVSQQVARPNLDGTWTVTVQDANNAVSTNTMWLPPTPTAVGRVWKMNAGGGTVDFLSIERITERRVGRPFGLYRGRSRRRVAS